MKLRDEEGRIKTRWHPTLGEPSSTLRRLWGKLLASRKGKPAGTHDASEGEMQNGNETGRTLPDF